MRVSAEVLERAHVEAYLRKDPVLGLLDSAASAGGDQLVLDRWLRESPAKRCLVWQLYGDLLTTGGRSVHDVGGGISSLTEALARRNRYVLTDIGAHHRSEAVRRLRERNCGIEVRDDDWYAHRDGRDYDVTVACDLFPNVDQRLEEFLRYSIEHCTELRLALTFYNEPRHYAARRVGGDEMFTIVAWNGARTWGALHRVLGRRVAAYRRMFSTCSVSAFPNGRQVTLVRIERAN
jgi:hypothetical protein